MKCNYQIDINLAYTLQRGIGEEIKHANMAIKRTNSKTFQLWKDEISRLKYEMSRITNFINMRR
jgi:hypothetical protein